MNERTDSNERRAAPRCLVHCRHATPRRHAFQDIVALPCLMLRASAPQVMHDGAGAHARHYDAR